MNYELLKTELQKPEYAELTAAQIVELLNDQNQTRRVILDMQSVSAYLIFSDLGPKLDYALKNRTDLTQEQSLAGARAQLTYSTQPHLDMDLPLFQDGLTTMVQAGIWTQAEADAFNAISLVPISKAEKEFGRLVSEGDVNRALNLDALTSIEALRTQVATAYNAVVAELDSATTSLIVPTGEGLAATFEAHL